MTGKDMESRKKTKQDVVRQAMPTSVAAMVDDGDQVIGCVLLGDFNLRLKDVPGVLQSLTQRRLTLAIICAQDVP